MFKVSVGARIPRQQVFGCLGKCVFSSEEVPGSCGFLEVVYDHWTKIMLDLVKVICFLCTMVIYHQTTISEDMFYVFQAFQAYPGIQLELQSIDLSHARWTWNIHLICGCFNWMIPSLSIGNGCLAKHPFSTGCLEFQVGTFDASAAAKIRAFWVIRLAEVWFSILQAPQPIADLMADLWTLGDHADLLGNTKFKLLISRPQMPEQESVQLLFRGMGGFRRSKY